MNGVKYWVSVVLGSLDDGLIAAGLVLLGGHSPEALASGTISLNLNKNTLTLAGVAGAWTMFKNVRAYLKVPPIPNGAPPAAPGGHP